MGLCEAVEGADVLQLIAVRGGGFRVSGLGLEFRFSFSLYLPLFRELRLMAIRALQ